MVFEKKVENKMVLAVSEEKLISQVAAVCAKVEKAQDAYKSIMEQTYLLHKYKVHKKYNMSFYDFMRQRTGMGNTTCITLIQIWKERLKLVENNPDAVECIDQLIKEAGMRQLIWLARHDAEAQNFIAGVDLSLGKYPLVDDLKTYIDSVEKRSSNESEEVAIESGESCDSKSDIPAETVRDFIISSVDEYNFMSNYLENVIAEGAKNVKVRIVYVD